MRFKGRCGFPGHGDGHLSWQPLGDEGKRARRSVSSWVSLGYMRHYPKKKKLRVNFYLVPSFEKKRKRKSKFLKCSWAVSGEGWEGTDTLSGAADNSELLPDGHESL